jgi:sulfite exporter TauE/SafE
MEDKAKRSPGGKLALWAFYAFCGYFLWAMARYWWVVGQIQSVPGATIDGELGSTAGKWIGALLGFLVLGIVGAILGAIAWYTRPNRRCMNITIKIAMLVAGLYQRNAHGPLSLAATI